MEDKKIPEMIWVFMLEACPGGTHEFADSVNNGPWGTALTTELIPDLEKKYRMDAKPSWEISYRTFVWRMGGALNPPISGAGNSATTPWP
jgi:hypothetical protein